MLKMTGRTIDHDLGLKKILAQIESFDGAVVDVGIFEGEQHPHSDLTVAEYAAVNEFGSKDGKIPERSFLRRAVRENESKWRRLLQKSLNRVAESKGRVKVFSALTVFGEAAAGDVRKTIDAVTEPPKAESTKRREGGALRRGKTGRVSKGAHAFQGRFDHPLIWTGTMKASVRARILVHGRRQMTPKGRV